MQKVSITDVYQCSQYAFARITSLLVYYFIILLNFFNFEHIHHVDLFCIHAHLFQYFPEFCNITWNSAVLLGILQYYLESTGSIRGCLHENWNEISFRHERNFVFINFHCGEMKWNLFFWSFDLLVLFLWNICMRICFL